MADLTYVPTAAGWVYTAFICDLFSRMVVGWQVADHMRADLALNALETEIWHLQHHRAVEPVPAAAAPARRHAGRVDAHPGHRQHLHSRRLPGRLGGLRAALSMSIIPVLIVYVVFQRQIQSGLTASALK